MSSSQSRLLRLHASIRRQGQRAYHTDVHINPKGKPIISQGTPGYSAVQGQVVTVFGCTGFLGRYIVQKLARVGTQIIVPYRDEEEKRHLKLMGDLGQIVNMEWDLRNETQIAECLRHSDTVINLTGRNFPTKNFSLHDVHVTGSANIAKLAASEGVANFIHVSHLNAAANSPSEFYKTKAEGEARVRDAFPTATIVRPGPMYGYEDKFLRNMHNWPIWWKLNHGQTTTRPVHVLDIAQALVNLTRMDPFVDRPINLPGPENFTHEWLLNMIETVTLGAPSKAPVLPKPLALLIAKIPQMVLYWPTISTDEVVRRYISDSEVEGDWDLVDVVPRELDADLAITYLRQYRSAENFTRPVRLPPRASEVASDTGYSV